MLRRVRDWYFRKVIAALRKAEIRYELHPKVKKPSDKKAKCVSGYCQERSGKWLIVIRYRPSEVNATYVIIHEALHIAFAEWPELDCWGEPIDMMARSLWFNFSTNQIREIESYLPGR